MFLTCEVQQDEILTDISNVFDYNFEGISKTSIPDFPINEIPENYNIGLIVGSSGSGKSTILKQFGEEEKVKWENQKAICSHFNDTKDCIDKLSAVGLNSIPDWVKPYSVLSTGQKFRADMARIIKDNAVIDEFTSVVDRNVAKSTSYAMSKYIKNNNIKGVVFASCHLDIIDWLSPDWVFNVDENKLARGSLQQPKIEVKLVPCNGEKIWGFFSKHHYLSDSFNKSSQSWVVKWDDNIIGFVSILAQPSGYISNAWILHRTVILPDFQGIGIGSKITEGVGEILLTENCRLFAKTSHPRIGHYRDNSKKWRPTSKNHISRPDYKIDNRQNKKFKNQIIHKDRICFSHEYIGDGSKHEKIKSCYSLESFWE